MFTIKFTEEAEQDLFSSASYILDVLKSASAANKLIEDVEKHVELLKDFPFLNDLVPDRNLAAKGIRLLKVNNYLVFYRIEEIEEEVTIVRFLYGRRDWMVFLSKSQEPNI